MNCPQAFPKKKIIKIQVNMQDEEGSVNDMMSKILELCEIRNGRFSQEVDRRRGEQGIKIKAQLTQERR